MGASYSIKVELHKQRGETENTPITAGSIVQGKVIIDITSSLYLSPNAIPTVLTPGTTGNATKPTTTASKQQQQNQQQQQDCHPNLSLLTIRIVGKEKVSMNISNAKKRYNQYNANNTNNNTIQAEIQYPKSTEIVFFDVTLPLSGFPLSAYDTKYNCIKVGTYKFPFQIQLPYELPSSTSYNPTTKLHHTYNPVTSKTTTDTSTLFTNLFTGSPTKNYGFRIQYKIHVEMHSTTKGDVIKTIPHYLWIRSAPKTTNYTKPVPAMVSPIAHEVQTKNNNLFSIDTLVGPQKGTLLIAASIDDSIISRSDTANSTANTDTTNNPDNIKIHIACRNNSRTDIQRIQLRFIEKINWGTVPITSSNNNTPSNTVLSCPIIQEENNLILFTINDISLPSLQKQSTTLVSTMTQSLFGTKTKTDTNYLKSIHTDLLTENSAVNISLPFQQLARDSYCGQLVQVSHHIEIQFITTPIGVTTTNQQQLQQQLGHNPIILIPIRMVNGQKQSVVIDDLTGSFCATIEECHENNDKLHEKPIQYTPQLGIASFDYEDDEKKDSNIDEIEINMTNVIPIPPPNTTNTNNESTTIPIASAIGNSTAILVGHDAASLSKLMPLAPPTNVKPSVSQLLSDIRTSVDAYSTIQKYTNPTKTMNNDEWVQLLNKINPFEYGQLIGAVPDPFDRSRVAVCIGQYINNNNNNNNSSNKGLTCDYIALAIRCTSDNNHNAEIVQELLPICTDVSTNHQIIINELSVWDQTVISSTLESILLNERMPTVPTTNMKHNNNKPNKVSSNSPIKNNRILLPAIAH